MFFPEHLIFGCKDNNNSSNESNNLCKKRKILDFYFDFSMRVVKFNATIPSKITSLAYAFFDLDQLWIGCEDGTIQAYDIRNINSPVLLFEKNVGGKVASIKQIGWHTTSHDWY